MAKVQRKIRYYSVRRNGRGFWEPPAWARAKGFSGIACGEDGPEAWARAEDMNAALDAARAGAEAPPPRYRLGSLAHWFAKWRTLDDFQLKGRARRDEFDTAWNHIEPRFGQTLVDEITASAVMAFHVDLDRGATEYTRWKTINILRSILIAARKHGVIDTAPELILANAKPAPRTELWFPQELEALQAAAEAHGKPELALAIWIQVETSLAPVDVRSLALSMIRADHVGTYIDRARSKTRTQATPAISDDLAAAIQAYVAGLQIDLTPDAEILRRAGSGLPWRDAPDMAKDFRRIRDIIMPGERRQMRDIRRSVSFWADLGGASPDERGALLANTIGTNAALDRTYSPANVIKSRRTQEKRDLGMEIMRQLWRPNPEQDSEHLESGFGTPRKGVS